MVHENLDLEELKNLKIDKVGTMNEVDTNKVAICFKSSQFVIFDTLGMNLLIISIGQQ